MKKAILTTQQLSIGYATGRRLHVVASDLNLSLLAGELVCLVGPNGAGKSTLMRTLAGMQSPLAGQVRLLGDDVHRLDAKELARRLSIVLTERTDVGLLSGYGLVALGRHPYTAWHGQLSAYDEAVINWAVDAVGAQDLAARPVSELSDGERQKIMIARALAQEPALMLLDEPTAYLDLPRRVEIIQLLRSLAHTTQRAILLSIHDLDLALRSADRIWLIGSDGQLVEGAPEDLVLSGAFEAAFLSEGVRFDQMTGSFRLVNRSTRRIRLQGEGASLIWTQRALERHGYQIHADAELLVEASAGGWRLTGPGETLEFEQIYALLQVLEANESELS